MRGLHALIERIDVAEIMALMEKYPGAQVGEGDEGENQTRGPHITIGLQKRHRDAVFTPDGFLRTGDIGMEDGQVRCKGRGGDVIKTNGAHVSAAYVTTFAAGVMAAYKVPTVVAIVDYETVPMTPNGKLDLRQCRALLESYRGV